jgi:hypothetical protein
MGRRQGLQKVGLKCQRDSLAGSTNGLTRRQVRAKRRVHSGTKMASSSAAQASVARHGVL